MKSLLTLFCLLSSLFLIGQEKNAQDESIRYSLGDELMLDRQQISNHPCGRLTNKQRRQLMKERKDYLEKKARLKVLHQQPL